MGPCEDITTFPAALLGRAELAGIQGVAGLLMTLLLSSSWRGTWRAAATKAAAGATAVGSVCFAIAGTIAPAADTADTSVAAFGALLGLTWAAEGVARAIHISWLAARFEDLSAFLAPTQIPHPLLRGLCIAAAVLQMAACGATTASAIAQRETALAIRPLQICALISKLGSAALELILAREIWRHSDRFISQTQIDQKQLSRKQQLWLTPFDIRRTGLCLVVAAILTLPTPVILLTTSAPLFDHFFMYCAGRCMLFQICNSSRLFFALDDMFEDAERERNTKKAEAAALRLAQKTAERELSTGKSPKTPANLRWSIVESRDVSLSAIPYRNDPSGGDARPPDQSASLFALRSEVPHSEQLSVCEMPRSSTASATK
ncbi:hypothetical protein HK105_205480 [Polyrhizophydium stewartii]|uniref:Uncharacterized protein n=1 Tax=Polyrhizophydium stewartii TaxID=2732419 RepID=A0ABR4N5W7_9FUNG